MNTKCSLLISKFAKNTILDVASKGKRIKSSFEPKGRLRAVWTELLFVEALWKEPHKRAQGILFAAAVGGAASRFRYPANMIKQ